MTIQNFHIIYNGIFLRLVEYCNVRTHCRMIWHYVAGSFEDVMAGKYAGIITATQCNTSYRDEAASILGSLSRVRGSQPITSIVHSSGVLADATLPFQTAG